MPRRKKKQKKSVEDATQAAIRPFSYLIAFAAGLIAAGVLTNVPEEIAETAPGADTQPPVAQFIAPQNKITIGDGQKRLHSIRLDAEVTDNIAVKDVTLYVDGQLRAGFVPQFGGKEGAYVAYWSGLGSVKNGEHTLEVRAVDGAGNESVDDVTVVVNNAKKLDETGPLLSIVSPGDDAEISAGSEVTVRVEARDIQEVSEDEELPELDEEMDAVERVDIFVSSTGTGFRDRSCNVYHTVLGVCVFEARGVAGDEFTIEARAYDREGNVSVDTTMFVLQ